MTKIMKEKGLLVVAWLLTVLAVFTVNSTCYICLGQEKEPDSLKRLKRIQKNILSKKKI